MISKELLSAVMSITVIDTEFDTTGEYDPCVQINYSMPFEGLNGPENSGVLLLNLHELAHLCKEWAYRRYSISSWKQYFGYGVKLTDSFGNSPKNLVITEATEPEAIFKACEWILRQKNDK